MFRLRDLEQALVKDFSPTAVAHCRVDPGTMLEDLVGTSEYRANLVVVMARRALEHLGEAVSYK